MNQGLQFFFIGVKMLYTGCGSHPDPYILYLSIIGGPHKLSCKVGACGTFAQEHCPSLLFKIHLIFEDILSH